MKSEAGIKQSIHDNMNMEKPPDSLLKFLSRYLENSRELIKDKKTLVLQTKLLKGFYDLLGLEILTEVEIHQLASLKSLFSQLIGVSLIQVCSYGGLIDLSVFSQLVHLELNRVSLAQIMNINQLKTQLYSLKCYKCEESSLLSKKGKFQWTELLELTIQRSTKDVSFLTSMPWLNKLDISNNDLGVIDESIQALEHLTFLNISFNRLTTLPKLNTKVYFKLSILLASNNYLSNMDGLEEMKSLHGLDFSWNWIKNTYSLETLTRLTSLKWIKLCNNPISFGKTYRALLSRFITIEFPDEFSIDNKKLDDYEQLLTGDALKECGQQHRSTEPDMEPLLTPDNSIQAKTKIKRKKVRRIGFAGHSGIVLSSSNSKDQNWIATKKTPMDDYQVFDAPEEAVPLPDISTLDKTFQGLVPVNTSTPYHAAEVVVHSGSNIEIGFPDSEGLVASDDSETKFELAKSWSEGESANKAQHSDGYQSSDEEITETMWRVEKIDKIAGTSESLLLVLLEKELKERSPFNNRVICKWPIDSILKCNKTKQDPITIDLEFLTNQLEKQNRSYIMEFADAQVLLRKVYHSLEARNHILMERILKEQMNVILENSDVYNKLTGQLLSSHSSIGEEMPIEKDLSESTSIFNDDSYNTIPSEPSIVTSDLPSVLNTKLETLESCNKSSSPSPSTTSTDSATPEIKPTIPKKCDSDIEIISNPSQSSIETLDENNTTPSRKKSSEERQTVAVPNLSTLHELPAPIGLTESSSSGSLAESVITAYDAHNNKKAHKSKEMENFPECDTAEDILEEKEVNENTTKEMYSYSQFSEIDYRIKLYLDQTIFNDKNEELSLFARCHLWKTGGSDFDGCVAFSNQRFYTFYHISNDFSTDSCEWLMKNDSFSLPDEILTLYFNQGLEVRIKNVSYFLLFMDWERTESFSNALKEKKFKLQKPNGKVAERLQQVVSSYESTRQIFDPTVIHFSVCKSIEIVRDKENEDFTRLAGLAITSGGFYVTSGDLSWLTFDRSPSIQSYQDISSLIEVKRNSMNLVFRFLDEAEAVEEVWTVKLVTNDQILKIIEAIKIPWEELFSVPLDIFYF